MKRISGFLLLALTLIVSGASASPVATTVGSNLTAYNPTSGSTNNAMWNAYMNPRSNVAASAPAADFGNCNAIILRCAQPKCANGGCSSMEIARPIVTGCVESNASCKQYGTDLIEYIAAQLVSDSTAAATQAAAASQAAAAQQSNLQMQQMQQQMAAMQQQMQQQSADTAAQIQAALEQQSAATAAAIAEATAATQQNAATSVQPAQTTNATTPAATDTSVNLSAGALDLTAAQQLAAASGVDANLLAREQIAGEILTKIENAEVNLKSAKAAMDAAFEYAGCDSTGSNCSGPARVSKFKQRALEFFDPYNDVLNELYDALILAQSVGVDITDIYMMLNGTCNVWGQYLCSEGQVMHYNSYNCQNGKSVSVYTGGGRVYGGAVCTPGQVVPMSDGGCQLIKMLTDQDEVQRNWLYPEEGLDGAQVRVGCASEALDNSFLFRNLKRQADIDIEVLQRIIEQDAPASYGRLGLTSKNRKMTPEEDGLLYCALNDETYQDLQKIATLKQLPKTVCVDEKDMRTALATKQPISSTSSESTLTTFDICAPQNGVEERKCLCENAPHNYLASWDEEEETCKCEYEGQVFDWECLMCVDEEDVGQCKKLESDERNENACSNTGGEWDEDDGKCLCNEKEYDTATEKCDNGEIKDK